MDIAFLVRSLDAIDTGPDLYHQWTVETLEFAQQMREWLRMNVEERPFMAGIA
jgi:hypothetical protein